MQLILADDHTLFREAFVFYLAKQAPDIGVLAACDLHGAMEMLADDRADVRLALLDLRMPGMNGLAGLEKLRRARPALPVAILSGLAEQRDIDEAARLGAAGYFPKTLPIRAMLAGIRRMLDGEIYFARDHNTDRLLPAYGGLHEGQAVYAPALLTPREQQVLRLLASGQSNKAIADALGLQVVTVKLHVRGVCRKLGAANRTQAALRAREFLA